MMGTLDQKLTQWFMVVGCGLKAKYCLFKTILDFEGVCLDEKPIKAFNCVIKDQSFKQCLSCGCTKKGIVLILGYIYPNNQMLFGSPNLFLKLTELL
ncbi:hypothetical protein ES703_113804 [subsurface metagenome]